MADGDNRDIAATGAAPDLDALARAATRSAARGLPPVHLWNPPHCGDIGLRIARDGVWCYRGSPIRRLALTLLFSTILRKDPDGYVLVTPVEKVSVAVEDAPFLAVEMRVDTDAAGPRLSFRTNVDDWTSADATHPLRFEAGPSGGIKPYVLVRGDLWALATSAVAHDLVERGETRQIEGSDLFGVASAGAFFPICPAGDIEDPQ